jgi:F0F1-type ATP synthase membrane subunit b/b'|tara:strand:- start:548 stop:904 length:357 start_codon:yes stop_codon:yes gene_type:complete
MSKKNTLNIYEVLEALNNKINNNTTLIENNTKQLEDKTNQLKIQLEESKIYLLETIEQKVKSNLDFLTSEFKKEANENRKNINSKQERLVTEEFKKLKIDINNDLETLANNIMNSQIL